MTLARPVLIALVAALASSTASADQGDRTRITTASSVRLRANPSDRGAIVATLPLGADLVEHATPVRPLTETLDAANRSWVHVRTADGRIGWVLSGLTRPLTADRRLEVVEDIVKRRLVRPDDDFAARTELIEFIERELGKTSEPESAARLALARLQAITRALESIGHGHRTGLERLRTWPRARQDLLVYNEPGGSWMLRHEAIANEHARHRAAAAADDLAWLAATNGLPGECEGDTGCYLTRDDLLFGGYLRRHPQGSHVDSALTRIQKQAALYRKLVEDPRFFKPSTDCGPMTKPLLAVRAAVAATAAAGRDPALEALDELAHRCTGG
jgi:hypothetical protein